MFGSSKIFAGRLVALSVFALYVFLFKTCALDDTSVTGARKDKKAPDLWYELRWVGEREHLVPMIRPLIAASSGARFSSSSFEGATVEIPSDASVVLWSRPFEGRVYIGFDKESLDILGKPPRDSVDTPSLQQVGVSAATNGSRLELISLAAESAAKISPKLTFDWNFVQQLLVAKLSEPGRERKWDSESFQATLSSFRKCFETERVFSACAAGDVPDITWETYVELVNGSKRIIQSIRREGGANSSPGNVVPFFFDALQPVAYELSLSRKANKCMKEIGNVRSDLRLILCDYLEPVIEYTKLDGGLVTLVRMVQGMEITNERMKRWSGMRSFDVLKACRGFGLASRAYSMPEEASSNLSIHPMHPESLSFSGSEFFSFNP